MASYSRERPKTMAYVGWPYALSPFPWLLSLAPLPGEQDRPTQPHPHGWVDGLWSNMLAGRLQAD